MYILHILHVYIYMYVCAPIHGLFGSKYTNILTYVIYHKSESTGWRCCPALPRSSAPWDTFGTATYSCVHRFKYVYMYNRYYIYIHLKVPSETRYWSRSRSFLFSTAKPMLSQCHLQSSGLLWVVTVWHVHSPRPVSPLVSYLELQAGTCSAGITRPLT